MIDNTHLYTEQQLGYRMLVDNYCTWINRCLCFLPLPVRQELIDVNDFHVTAQGGHVNCTVTTACAACTSACARLVLRRLPLVRLPVAFVSALPIGLKCVANMHLKGLLDTY